MKQQQQQQQKGRATARRDGKQLPPASGSWMARPGERRELIIIIINIIIKNPSQLGPCPAPPQPCLSSSFVHLSVRPPTLRRYLSVLRTDGYSSLLSSSSRDPHLVLCPLRQRACRKDSFVGR
ncbi:hypothetical protein LX32DRAFT_62344 [Colletotrichum zoysiae]|uniref:Uncharacterized protein n=1 Tax=Colletotrichum zoysiae TaxID=1216348 RepID=A0AAD9M0Y3_9PEZI|nr:hypothetical protein LX32DRAFT_62344 [Colletotrichum zoysiae]